MQELNAQVQADSDYEDINPAPIQIRRRQGVRIDEVQANNLLKCVQITCTKIYVSQDCPICLCPSDNVPLKCGHAFCSTDIENLLDQCHNQIVQCPVCRQYQNINNINELYQLKETMTTDL